MAYVVTLTNFSTQSDPFETFEEAAAWATKACFEATILDTEVQINWGYLIVGVFSPIGGLTDLRRTATEFQPRSMTKKED